MRATRSSPEAEPRRRLGRPSSSQTFSTRSSSPRPGRSRDRLSHTLYQVPSTPYGKAAGFLRGGGRQQELPGATWAAGTASAAVLMLSAATSGRPGDHRHQLAPPKRCQSTARACENVRMAPFVLVNGKIVTVDKQSGSSRRWPSTGNGSPLPGLNADVLACAGPGAAVVDLDGATVIPGLIDNHNHFVRASEHAEVRLEGVRSRARALDALRSAGSSLPQGQWLVALGGWHEEQWVGDRSEFTVAELDAVAGRRPAFVMAEYDHAVVNTAWLDAMGLPAEAETRAAGRIGGGIVALNQAVGAFPVPADREATAKAAASWYNSVGLTTVFDPGGVGVPAQAYATVADLAERGELTLRVLATLGDGASGRGPGHTTVMAERLRDCMPYSRAITGTTGSRWGRSTTRPSTGTIPASSRPRRRRTSRVPTRSSPRRPRPAGRCRRTR